MKTGIERSAELMELFDHTVETYPAFPDLATRRLRMKLLWEEMGELILADQANDLVEFADGIADMKVILDGTGHTHGLPMQEIELEVHRSNMAKADPVTGKLMKRKDGKVLKPDGWTPPDVEGIINKAKNQSNLYFWGIH